MLIDLDHLRRARLEHLERLARSLGLYLDDKRVHLPERWRAVLIDRVHNALRLESLWRRFRALKGTTNHDRSDV